VRGDFFEYNNRVLFSTVYILTQYCTAPPPLTDSKALGSKTLASQTWRLWGVDTLQKFANTPPTNENLCVKHCKDFELFCSRDSYNATQCWCQMQLLCVRYG